MGALGQISQTREYLHFNRVKVGLGIISPNFALSRTTQQRGVYIESQLFPFVTTTNANLNRQHTAIFVRIRDSSFLFEKTLSPLQTFVLYLPLSLPSSFNTLPYLSDASIRHQFDMFGTIKPADRGVLPVLMKIFITWSVANALNLNPAALLLFLLLMGSALNHLGHLGYTTPCPSPAPSPSLSKTRIVTPSETTIHDPPDYLLFVRNLLPALQSVEVCFLQVLVSPTVLLLVCPSATYPHS